MASGCGGGARREAHLGVYLSELHARGVQELANLLRAHAAPARAGWTKGWAFSSSYPPCCHCLFARRNRRGFVSASLLFHDSPKERAGLHDQRRKKHAPPKGGGCGTAHRPAGEGPQRTQRKGGQSLAAEEREFTAPFPTCVEVTPGQQEQGELVVGVVALKKVHELRHLFNLSPLFLRRSRRKRVFLLALLSTPRLGRRL